MPDDPIQSVTPPDLDLSGLTGDPSGLAGLQQTPPIPPEAAASLFQPSDELQAQIQPTGMDMGQLQTQQPGNLPQLPPRPPGTGVASQPVDRKAYFRQMLGDFLYSIGQGLSNRGSGPDADLRGAGAAINAIPQRNIMQQQIEIQKEQAAAAQRYKEAQAASLTPSIAMTDPSGNTVLVPPAHVGQALGQQYRLAGTLGAAAMNVQGKKDVANINAQNRMDVEHMKALVAAGQIGKVAPATDDQGNTVMRAYNKFGKPIGDLDGAIPPSQYLGKTTTSQRIEKDENGNYLIIPTTSTTTPNIPGKGGTGGVKVNKGVIQVTDSEGNPVSGQPLTTSTRTMVEAAPKVIGFVDRINNLIDQNKDKMGPIAGRWSEFMAGKVGAPNVGFAQLRTDVGLLQTLLMRMHVGSRGGEYIMKHFTDLIDSGKQSPENLKAALGEIKIYAQQVASEGKPKATPKAGGKGYSSDNPFAH